MDFLSEYWLDILTTVLGLIYIWLEYRVSIALWFVGVIMPALDVWLYWSHGLYGDAGMAVYYTLAALYGFYVWKFKKTRKLKQSLPIIHLPRRQYLPATLFFFFAWGATYYILVTWTNSTVPLLDSFTNALSFVGMWALARKYLEQWFFWIVIGAQVSGTVVLLDCGRCRLLFSLYSERHSLQGGSLWAICCYRYCWLL